MDNNNTQKVLIGEIEINNPKLWWPIGHGNQSLYNLKISQKGLESFEKENSK